ncbi:hypothetical protein RFI_28532, partial [Reticulomyxa filosa]
MSENNVTNCHNKKANNGVIMIRNGNQNSKAPSVMTVTNNHFENNTDVFVVMEDGNTTQSHVYRPSDHTRWNLITFLQNQIHSNKGAFIYLTFNGKVSTNVDMIGNIFSSSTETPSSKSLIMITPQNINTGCGQAPFTSIAGMTADEMISNQWYHLF